MSEDTIITVRYSRAGTHIARCNGVTCSNTSDYRAAANSLGRKMFGDDAFSLEFIEAKDGIHYYRIRHAASAA